MNELLCKTNFIPKNLELYFANKELVPESVDFYYLTSPVQKIAIRIFPHLLQKGNDSTNVFSSTVIVTTGTKVMKLGLHLFPVMRFKRQLPPIEIHLKDAEKKKTFLSLPPSIQRRLSDFLELGKPHLKFTCAQFALFLHQIPDLYALRIFDRLPFDSSIIIPGEIVMLLDQNNHFLHMAIYLGADLYMEHSGPTCLQITTYNEMVEHYKAAKGEILRQSQTKRPFIIDIYSTDCGVDLNLAGYWNGLPVPAELDFYEDIAQITDVEIEINQKIQLCCTANETGAKFQVTNTAVILKTANEILKIGLHLFPIMRVKRPLPDARIYLLDGHGERKSLPFAQDILKRLSKYLEAGKPDPNFCCYDFVDHLNGLPHDSPITYKFSPFDPNEIRPGESIVLHDANQTVVHAAFYIGEGLYLWHQGNTCLRISTLQEMENAYSSKGVKKALLNSGRN